MNNPASDQATRPFPVPESGHVPGVGEECPSGFRDGDGSNGTHPPSSQPMSKPKEIHTDVPFERRRLNLGATPDTGTFVISMDLDLTVACNLRCTYCFKEKWNEHMEEQVAFDALVWLLYASGPARDLTVNFMGGEPLMRFPLIKRIVPFGKRRAWQMNKTMHFGVTTNGTLVTDKVVEFWKNWGMGFHTSIDGVPEIQDRNRPMASGRGSARLVEKAVPKILSYRPDTAARCTVVPESVGSLVKNYRYFRSLGYTNIVFSLGVVSSWTKESNTVYEQQISELGDILIEEFRNGRFIRFNGIDAVIEGIVQNQRPKHLCGAGRGMLLVDIHGDIWPCHRWNKASERNWRIGSIYEHFSEMARAGLDRDCQTELVEADCDHCIANKCCTGGCPAENLEETGNVYKPHPNTCEHARICARVGQRVHDVLQKEQNPTFLEHYYKKSENAA
jgi:uncharacterized protein